MNSIYKTSKLIFSLLLCVIFLNSINAQTIISEKSAQALDLTIIKNKTIISTTTSLNDSNGIYLGSKGVFVISKGVKLTIDTKLNVFQNRQIFFGEGTVLFNAGSVHQIDVTWFGAKPNDQISDVIPIQKAINTAIMSPGVSVVYFPPGEYTIDSPLLAMRKMKRGKDHDFFNLTLRGHQFAYNNPRGKKGGVSVLKANNEIPFVLGIQAARGVHVENMVFDGYIPSKMSKEDLVHIESNKLYKQDRFAPLSAIVIDPFSLKKPIKGGYNGMDEFYINKRSSSRIHIEGSVIQNFPTGIAISPNGKTQQGDSVAITFTRFNNLINGIVICQAQSRNIVVDNCDFSLMKFVFNTDDFGEQQGVLPEVNNLKVSGGVAWLYKANGNIAYGHFRNVYTEALYGIGYSVINKQPLNFEGCVFKFRSMTDPIKGNFNPCILRADNASFTGCTFLVGGGKNNVEPLLMDVKKATFVNCYFDTYPINIGGSLKNKNESTYINSGLRKNKIATTSWKSIEFNENKVVVIEYDTSKKSFYFKNNFNFKKGEFIFGNLTINKEPFKEKSIYTAIGKVLDVKNNFVYFKSKYLEKKKSLVEIILN
ncbi:MAG: hypothetical protein ACI9SJ_000535 [Flavobacteriaceae bacterium]|jgi:hypothetical protein|uniref:glycosyl hydrolase family 28-related protein n=1 Tax=Candidatus Marifrigoribacter sp. Uisw_064 TaxID=3230970 RepID=UPI003AD83625